jgi:predicted DNA-binding transcriptional regulator AlpA
MTKEQNLKQMADTLTVLFPKKLLNINETAAAAGISRNTVYRRVEKGTFPAPRKVKSPHARGPRIVNRWSTDEIMNWKIKEQGYYQKLEEEAMKSGRNSHIDPTVPDAEYYQEDTQPKRRINPMFVTAAIVGVICGILWGIGH